MNAFLDLARTCISPGRLVHPSLHLPKTKKGRSQNLPKLHNSNQIKGIRKIGINERGVVTPPRAPKSRKKLRAQKRKKGRRKKRQFR